MIKDIILDLIFPKYCIGCGKEGHYICKDCEIYMTDVPETTELTVFWEYNGIVKEAIRRIKDEGEFDIIKELINKKDFSLAKDTVITYVPITKEKKKRRGFNQAEIIAQEIGKKTGRPIVRLSECNELNENIYKEKKVLLVDDVYITGTTMRECSRALKQVGFKNMHLFAICRQT